MFVVTEISSFPSCRYLYHGIGIIAQNETKSIGAETKEQAIKIGLKIVKQALKGSCDRNSDNLRAVKKALEKDGKYIHPNRYFSVYITELWVAK